MLPTSTVETGAIDDQFPYVRVASGLPPLVVVPGVGDAMFDGTYLTATGWALRWYFARFVDDHAVYVISRQRGLPAGHAIEDMADDYAAAIETAIGPADVLGLSMGGMIGQALAVRHPSLVDRLVLANTGRRFAAPGAIRRFRSYATDRTSVKIAVASSARMFAQSRSVAYPSLVLTLGRLVAPRPAVPADVEISLDAVDAFDATDRLDAIDAPTLVFGGTADPFFPEPVLSATADGITDARRSFAPGAKHGAFHERKATFDRRVDAFLDGN